MVAAVAIVTVASCAQEIDNPGQNSGKVIFTAYADGAETKTVLGMNEETGKPLSMWKGEEWIQVVGKGGNYWMNTQVGETPSASAMVYYNGNNGEFNEKEGVFAVYPAGNEKYGKDGDLVTGVSVPTIQTAVAGSYDPNAAAAIAYTENNELKFKNVTSLIQFQVATEGVKSVTIAPNGTENLPRISGKCSVSADGTVIPWTTNEHESESYVELTTDSGFETGKDYYVAVFPCTMENGFKVEFSFGGNKIEVASYEPENALVLPRNQILNIGLLECEVPEWSIAGTLNNWNTLETPFAAEGDYWVAKSVSFKESGKFKIVNKGSVWRSISESFAVGKWFDISDGDDISIPAGTYDFYLTKDGKNLQVVSAGSATPLAPGKIPAEKGWVYLKPNSNWTQSNAWFAVYLCNGTAGTKWIKMTKTTGTDYYGAELPAGYDATKYKNIIFVRMDSGKTALDWASKWNQSGDLPFSNVVNGKNCCSINSGQWDCGTNVSWYSMTELN